jgi:hypothetical protein
MDNFEEWWETYDPLSYELMTDDMKNAFESGYNKAIDDLVEDTTGPYTNWVEIEVEDVLERKIG